MAKKLKLIFKRGVSQTETKSKDLENEFMVAWGKDGGKRQGFWDGLVHTAIFTCYVHR